MISKFLLLAATGELTKDYWIARLSTASNNEYVSGLAVTANNDIYFCGKYPTSPGYALIGKMDKNANLSWQRSLGSGGFYSYAAADIALDSSENSYIALNESGGGTRAIVCSYSSSGSIRWQRSITNAYINAIATNSSGDTYIAGFTGSFNAEEAYIAKYNSSGVLQWQNILSMDEGESSLYSAITLDASDNPVVCGIYTPSTFDRFLTVKYNSSGVLQFQRSVHTANANWTATAITADAFSNVFVFGKGNDALGAIKYTSNGTYSASTVINRTVDSVAAATKDSSGNIYIVSTDNIGTYFSGTERRNDFYAVKYDNSLSVQYQRYLGTANSETAYAIAVQPFSLYLAGAAFTSFVFGPTAPNGLIAHLALNGSGTGTYDSYYYNSASWSTVSMTLLFSTTSISDSSVTLTETASTLLDSSVTLTVTKTDI